MNQQLQTYLYDHIPISKALGAQVIEAHKNTVAIKAPLDLNINHKHTAFGGSLQAIATLACWSLLHINLRGTTNTGEIVITNSNIDYIRPVTQDFTAYASLPADRRWQQFIRTFERRGKARLQLTAHIYDGDELAIDYTGTFAAIAPE